MAAVIDISPAPRGGVTPSYRKIRAASRAFELLFSGLFGFFILLTLASIWVILFYQGTLITLGPNGGLISTNPPADAVPFSAWALNQKLAYVVVAIVRAAPSILLFWCLRALFRLYGEGQVFAPRNAAIIKLMGVCLVADALAPFACHVVLSATGYEIDKVWMHLSSVQELVLGAIVFVIALVMQAGREIEEDRAGFV